jgi:hypothetical protein
MTFSVAVDFERLIHRSVMLDVALRSAFLEMT